jgi:hypothetical protein
MPLACVPSVKAPAPSLSQSVGPSVIRSSSPSASMSPNDACAPATGSSGWKIFSSGATWSVYSTCSRTMKSYWNGNETPLK